MNDHEKRTQSSRKYSEAADRERVRKVQQAARASYSSGNRNAQSRGTGRSNYRPKTTASRNRRRRRRGPDWTKILLIVGGVLLLILLVTVGLRSCKTQEKNAAAGLGDTQTSATEPETEMKKEIEVDGIAISGMTHAQASDAILSSVDWKMKISYNGEEMEVENLLEAPLEELLTSIYSSKASSLKDSYTLKDANISEAATAVAQKAADLWNVKAQNAGIGDYNVSTSRFSFIGGKNGVAIEQESLAQAIQDAVKAGNYQAVLEASAKETTPKVSLEQAKEMYTTIGTYTTKTTSNKDRNTNVSLAAAAINGKILAPGETFSMNSATGERTYEKGYRPAGAYVNGELVLEPGGGVCQVSSTLYNAVVFAGLKTTERYAHSYEPSYVTPGEDAMISYPGLDMKFVNNTDYSVGLKANFSNQTLTISIVGVSNLEEGEKISMQSEKVSEIDPPEPKYEEDTTLQPGEEVVVKKAQPGSKWVTYLVKTKNGEVVSKEVFHNSTYKGKAATIKRNTSGKVTESNSAEPTTEAPSIQDGTLDTILPGGEGSTGVNTDETEKSTQSSTSATSESKKETEKASEPESSKAPVESKPEETSQSSNNEEVPQKPSGNAPQAPSEPTSGKEISPGGPADDQTPIVVDPNRGIIIGEDD